MKTRDLQKKYPMVWTKRIFDVLVAGLVTVILSPLFLLIILLIIIEQFIRCHRLVSPFYFDRRMSRGEEFDLIKFNIFNQDAVLKTQKEHGFVNTKVLEWDGDITWTGIVLRQIYFDEFPQLMNVLKGDMSLVGPRPVNLKVYEQRVRDGDTAKPRIKAGMTGNFQSTKNSYTASDFELDREYLDYYASHSPVEILKNDISIIFRTLKVVLRARGE